MKINVRLSTSTYYNRAPTTIYVVVVTQIHCSIDGITNTLHVAKKRTLYSIAVIQTLGSPDFSQITQTLHSLQSSLCITVLSDFLMDFKETTKNVSVCII